jgi:ankyrin repeat protein
MTRQILLIFWIFLLADLALGDDRTDELFKALRARDAAQVDAILTAEPSLVNAKVKDASATEVAMFFVSNDGFVPVQSNDVLKAVLAHKPKFDLFEVASLGDTKTLQRMLDADPSAIRAKNHFGWTAFHIAAFAGNVANVKLLLDRGADVNLRAATKFRNTPLQIAMLTGQLETAKLLLDRGADVLDRQAKGFCAMHEAALLGRIDLMQLLIDRGAEINSRSDDGRTPLSEAMRGKHADAVEFLKSKGAIAEVNSAKLSESPD